MRRYYDVHLATKLASFFAKHSALWEADQPPHSDGCDSDNALAAAAVAATDSEERDDGESRASSRPASSAPAVAAVAVSHSPAAHPPWGVVGQRSDGSSTVGGGGGGSSRRVKGVRPKCVKRARTMREFDDALTIHTFGER